MMDGTTSTEAAVSLMTLLRRHRLAKGYTQEKLARFVGVTTSAVSLWETGKTIPSPEMFPKLARIFGIDSMELTRVIQPETSHPGAAAK